MIGGVAPGVGLCAGFIARILDVEDHAGRYNHVGAGIALDGGQLRYRALGETVFEGLYQAAMHMGKVGNVHDILNNVAGFGTDA